MVRSTASSGLIFRSRLLLGGALIATTALAGCSKGADLVSAASSAAASVASAASPTSSTASSAPAVVEPTPTPQDTPTLMSSADATPVASADAAATPSAKPVASSKVSASASAKAAPKSVPGAVFAQTLNTAIHAQSAHIRSSTAGTTTSADISPVGTTLNVRTATTIAGHKATIVFAGNDMYLKIDGLDMPTGKTWVHIGANATDALATQLAPTLQVVNESFSGTMTLDSLKDVTVSRVGTSKVNGQSVTVYRYTSGKAAAQANADMVEKLMAGQPQATIEEARKAALASKTVSTTYLDAHNRPVRVVSATTMSGKTTKTTIDYTLWGKASTVTKPAAASVVESSEIK